MEKPRTFVLLLLTLESVCREARRLLSLPFSLSCPYPWSGNGKKTAKIAPGAPLFSDKTENS